MACVKIVINLSVTNNINSWILTGDRYTHLYYIII